MSLQPVTIALADPIEGHDGKIKTIVVKPADYRTIMRLGEPFEFIGTAKGDGQYALEHPDTISSYIEAMVEPSVVALLPQLSMVDTLALKKAVLDFFGQARAPRAKSSKS
jgi:hypothetical protein